MFLADTTIPAYAQYMLGILSASFALYVLVYAIGIFISRRRQSLVPSFYAYSTFPGTYDVVYLALFMVYYVGSAALSLTQPPIESNPGSVTMFITMVSTGLQYVPMVIRIMLLPRPVTREPQITAMLPPPPRQMKLSLKLPEVAPLLKDVHLAFLAVGVSLMFSMLFEHSGLSEYLIDLFSCPKHQDIVTLFMKSDTTNCILIAITGIIIAPIGEECFFRGFVYGAMRKHTGALVAALCSSLLFSVIHCSIPAMLPLIVFALLQCLLYEKTGSLRAPIIAHAIFNSIQFLLMIFYPELA